MEKLFGARKRKSNMVEVTKKPIYREGCLKRGGLGQLQI